MKKNHLLFTLAMLGLSTIGYAQTASYNHPTPLRYIGTIKPQNPIPACVFTTRNPMNDGAFLWTPVGNTVKYTDTTEDAPISWNWTSESGELENATAQDAIIKYSAPGTYKFPKLTAGFTGGATSDYAPDYKLKVGGRAELCLADCRHWIDTYALGVSYYDNQNGEINGSLGGTNSVGILGVGNFYMLPIEDGFLDGVNVYLPSKPSIFKRGAKIRIRVWLAAVTPTEIMFTYMPIEGAEIKMEDIKTEADGVWVPISGGAVAQLTIENPIDLFGKQFIFIDVDGWTQNPAAEDFKILMDIMPNQQMQPEDAQNLLAHNSFVRLQNENDYLRPVSFFGGNYGSFMICPVVRGAETPFVGVSETIADSQPTLNCVVGNGLISITGNDGRVDIYDMNGTIRQTKTIVNGSATISSQLLGTGIFVARSADGGTAKFACK